MEAAGCQQLLGGRRDYRGYGLRELLRASREETMPIDRSRIRKGMFLVLDQPLPDYIPNGRRRFTKRPSDRFERLPPRDSDPITAFLGHRKPSTKALRRGLRQPSNWTLSEGSRHFAFAPGRWLQHRRPGLTKRNARGR